MPPYSPPPPPSTKGGADEETAQLAWMDSKNDRVGEAESSDDEEEESDEEESSEEEESDEEESDEDSDDDNDDDDDDEEASENDKLVDWSEDQKNKKGKKNRRGKSSNNKSTRKPLRNCCHSFFILIQIIAVLVNFVMIGVQLVPIFTWKAMVIEEKVVRYYLAFFNALFLLSEFDIGFIGLQNWAKRGIVYTFSGVMALDQRTSMIKYGFLNTKNDTSFGQTWNELWTSLIIVGTSWTMIGTGCLYFLMEIFCMRIVRDRCRKQYKKKVAAWEQKKKN